MTLCISTEISNEYIRNPSLNNKGKKIIVDKNIAEYLTEGVFITESRMQSTERNVSDMYFLSKKNKKPLNASSSTIGMSMMKSNIFSIDSALKSPSSIIEPEVIEDLIKIYNILAVDNRENTIKSCQIHPGSALFATHPYLRNEKKLKFTPI